MLLPLQTGTLKPRLAQVHPASGWRSEGEQLGARLPASSEALGIPAVPAPSPVRQGPPLQPPLGTQRSPDVAQWRPGTLLPGDDLQSELLPARPLANHPSRHPGPARLQDTPGRASAGSHDYGGPPRTALSFIPCRCRNAQPDEARGTFGVYQHLQRSPGKLPKARIPKGLTPSSPGPHPSFFSIETPFPVFF